MKLTNIASLDPVITDTGRKGLKGASKADRQMWEEMQNGWEQFVAQSENAVNEILSRASMENDIPPGGQIFLKKEQRKTWKP